MGSLAGMAHPPVLLTQRQTSNPTLETHQSLYIDIPGTIPAEHPSQSLLHITSFRLQAFTRPCVLVLSLCYMSAAFRKSLLHVSSFSSQLPTSFRIHGELRRIDCLYLDLTSIHEHSELPPACSRMTCNNITSLVGSRQRTRAV